MKLYFNRTSPYARKVLVVAHEKGLIGRLELCAVDPWIDPPDLLAVTPLAKVPALVTDEGVMVTESTMICEHFEVLGDGPRLIGPDRLAVSSRIALGQGLIDAAFAIVIERRRPAEHQWPAWIDRQRRAIERTLPRLTPGPGFDLGDITLACGLAYLDFRLPEVPWHDHFPALAAWFDQANRRPSMAATRP